ncbi:MAG: ABC transporter ATP-binding protein [Pseudomonadota bacterium]
MSDDMFSSLRLVRRELGEERPRLALAVALASGSVLLDMVPLWAVYQLTQSVASGTAEPALFWPLAALTAVTIPFGYFLFGLATRQSHTVAFNMIYDLRMRVARHIARLPMGYFSTRRSGQAKQTIVTEPERLELLVAHAMPEGTSAFFTWLIVTGWLFYVDWRMALAAVIFAPVSFVLMGFAIKASMSETAAYQSAQGAMNGAIVEHLTGMPAVKIFNPDGIDRSETAAAIDHLAQMQSSMARAFVPLGGTFYAMILANITLILIVGVWLLHAEAITLSVFLFFVIVGANYSVPLMRLFDLFHHFAQISLSASALQEILSKDTQPDTGRRVPLKGHDIAFEDVRFAYGDGPTVLEGISFTAREGEITALVGPSGAGKSTLAALIPRLFDVTGGRIALGGQDLRDIGLDQLMEAVAFVFQDPFLFSATVAENIRYGSPDATNAEVEAAARAAQAHEFIENLPARYATEIGPGSQLLSGGERQRIALARAILKDAPIVVLDEATAFTDPDSEYEIQQALGQLTRGKTVIVVAHRLHTIAAADQILLIDRGHIAERGTHEVLIAKAGRYARLWEDHMATRNLGLRGGDDGGR